MKSSQFRFRTYKIELSLTLRTSILTECFLIFRQVYDVTKFLEEHPGGDDVILSATGMRLHRNRCFVSIVVANLQHLMLISIVQVVLIPVSNMSLQPRMPLMILKMSGIHKLLETC